jgi:hypothetical protein
MDRDRRYSGDPDPWITDRRSVFKFYGSWITDRRSIFKFYGSCIADRRSIFISIFMEPLVIGLDQLQGEHNSGAYYGFLVPTIYSIRYKLQQLKTDSRISKLGSVLQQLIVIIEERFKSFFDVDESSRLAMVATFCHPQFKLYFLAEGPKKDAALKIVTEEFNKYKAASAEKATSSHSVTLICLLYLLFFSRITDRRSIFKIYGSRITDRRSIFKLYGSWITDRRSVF